MKVLGRDARWREDDEATRPVDGRCWGALAIHAVVLNARSIKFEGVKKRSS